MWYTPSCNSRRISDYPRMGRMVLYMGNRLEHRRRRTTACGGRAISELLIIKVECAPLMPGVRRMASMSSWQRKGLTAFALCLTGCSSPKSATVAFDAEAARRADVGTPAPSGSFRAAMVAFATLPEAIASEVAAAESISVRRSQVTEVVFPKAGDTVLVDVASYNEAQHLIERVNVFGVLQSRVADTWSVLDSRTHRQVKVRLSESSWSRAPHGVNRLRTMGEAVGQPAYYVQMERYATLPATGRIVEYQAAH